MKRRRKKIARRRWLNNSRWLFDEKSVRSTLLLAAWAGVGPLCRSWRWLGMGRHDCQVSKNFHKNKINILNFFLTPQTSSPPLEIMFLHRLHIRQKQIFCSFICNLTLDGIAYTFGVFLVPLMEYFELKEKGPISMIGNNDYTMEIFIWNSTIQISTWRYSDLTSLAQLHTFLVPIEGKTTLRWDSCGHHPTCRTLCGSSSQQVRLWKISFLMTEPHTENRSMTERCNGPS